MAAVPQGESRHERKLRDANLWQPMLVTPSGSARSGSPASVRLGQRDCEPEHALSAVGTLPREELVEHWIKFFGTAPPKGIKRGLLERAYAWQLQVRMFGGLKPSTRKALLAIANGSAIPGTTPVDQLKPGSRLLREWQGVTHRVDVMASGYVWNGQRYASLSAVALAITGSHRSGPRFFGLGAG